MLAVLVVPALLAVLATLWWRAGASPDQGRLGATAASGTDAASGAGRQAAAQAPSAEAASGQAGAVPWLPSAADPTHAPRPWTERAKRLRDDWCGFGTTERLRAFDRARASGATEPDAGADDPDVQRVQAWAQEQVQARWQAALRRRGDPRSLAVAEYLLASSDPVAAARLQALARSSADPMLTALAIAGPCPPGACRNVEATQWSRLEPENVLAWLVQWNSQAAAAPQADFLLERMASLGRYSRTYLTEAGQILLSVTLPDAPGLLQQTEAGMLSGVLAAQAVPVFSPLVRHCRESGRLPALAARCEAVAEALWVEGSLLERLIALAVVREVVPRSSLQRPVWERRGREAEAVRQLGDSRLASLMGEIPVDPRAQVGCETGLVMQRWMRESASRSDWDRSRAELAARGADLDALARQWREKNGRSVLDPVPPPGAASR